MHHSKNPIIHPNDPANQKYEPSVIFLDNGFLRNLISKPTTENFTKGFKRSASKKLLRILEEWRPWRTPFSILEWIGVSPGALKIPKGHIQQPITFTGIEEYFNNAKLSFAARKELQSSTLLANYQKQTFYVHEDFRHLWDSLMAGVFEYNLADWIHTALAFDTTNRLTLKSSLRADYYGALCELGFFSVNPFVKNFSKFRLADRMLVWAWEEMSKSTRESFRQAYKKIRLSSRGDSQDTDLIHVATLGVEDHLKKQHSTICLTCDRWEQVALRLGIYRGLAKWIRTSYLEQAETANFCQNFDTVYNGMVYCFNHKTGELLKHINVSEDIEPIEFIGNANQASEVTARKLAEPLG